MSVFYGWKVLAYNLKQPIEQSTSVASNITQQATLLFHPYLDKLNLAVNAEFHFLVCRPCQEAIPVTAGQTHIKSKHLILLGAYNKVQYQNAVADLGIKETLPNIIQGPRSAVHGLSVKESVLACQECPVML